jgi:cytochrome c553
MASTMMIGTVRRRYAAAKAGTGWICRVLRAFACLAAVTCQGVGAAEGDAAAGKAKSEACASCHEGDGRSLGLRLYPRIAGQHYAYLLQTLREYRSGERKAGYAVQMTDSVKELTDRDLQDIARYYSELPW